MLFVELFHLNTNILVCQSNDWFMKEKYHSKTCLVVSLTNSQSVNRILKSCRLTLKFVVFRQSTFSLWILHHQLPFFEHKMSKSVPFWHFKKKTDKKRSIQSIQVHNIICVFRHNVLYYQSNFLYVNELNKI